MIHHERCDIIELVEDDFYGDIYEEVRATNVPCSVSPIEGRVMVERGVSVITAYIWTSEDMTIPEGANLADWRIRWRGRGWQFYGSLEEHYHQGRLRHREAVLNRWSG